MAPQSDSGELPAAWRALSGSEARDGWRVIPVASGAVIVGPDDLGSHIRSELFDVYGEEG